MLYVFVMTVCNLTDSSYGGEQNRQSPAEFDAVLGTPHNSHESLTIPEVAFNMASDPKLLPPAKRQHQTPEQTLQSRCANNEAKTPVQVFMAAYGKQHLLNRPLLESKGLMTHFVFDPIAAAKPRMWAPVEALALHAMCGGAFIPHDPQEAWTIWVTI